MFRVGTQRALASHKSKLVQTIGLRQFSVQENLPSQADVVVIGGGSIGCHTLYQLSKRGVNAVLLERAKLTSGTTWHTGGLYWCLRPSDVDVQILGATRSLLRELEEETGENPGFVNNGGLFISRTEERLKEYKRLHTLGHYFGIESHIISSHEAAKLHPLLDPKTFNAALYSPGDGYIDPTIMCNTLTQCAKKRGAKVFENCSVTDILTEKSRGQKVIGVETNLGVIGTNHIINAAGAWSRKIAQKVGLEIPLAPFKHAYVITESIPEVKGTPNIRDHDGSIYYKTQGTTLHMGGYEINPEILKDVEDDFQFGLYDLDLSIFGAHLENAYQLTPALKSIGITKQICGPESFTPDHKPIMGEDPRLNGFYYACGMNSSGLMLGCGVGEQIADWVVKGKPDIPMYNYDIRRFTPATRINRAWITETSQEAYAKNYSIVFRHDQSLAGRNFKIGPFHEALVASGAVMEQAQSWERPSFFIKDSTAPVRGYDWYGHYDHIENQDKRYEKQLQGDYTFDFSKHHDLIGEEALAARCNAALFDLSYYSKMYLTGPDAEYAADWLFSANTDHECGKVVYTPCLNKFGGVEADMTVISLNQGVGNLVGPIMKGKGYYVVAGGAAGYHFITHLKKEMQRKKFRATITDVTDQLGILSIQGPKSGEILQALTEYPITDEKLPFAMSDLVTINGHVCRAIRLSFVGELGYELHIPLASCIPIYNHVMDVGKSFGIKHAGFRAMYSLSCEKGYHLWNADLRTDDNPVEAGLGRFCRKQGSYLGKDYVDKFKLEGVKKRRVFVTLRDRIPLWGNETLWRDDLIVGYLRRGEYGYFLKSSIGIGYIKHPNDQHVTSSFVKKGQYQVEIMGKRYPATVDLESPFDPKNQRLFGHYENQFQEQVHFED